MLTGFAAGNEGDSYIHGIGCYAESGLLAPPPLLQLHSLSKLPVAMGKQDRDGGPPGSLPRMPHFISGKERDAKKERRRWEKRMRGHREGGG